MKASQFLISTLKEAPADAEVASHKLMMRAGMIKKLGAGIYTYMPMGLRVIRKVEAIVREEMNRAGAVELSMPVVQPAAASFPEILEKAGVGVLVPVGGATAQSWQTHGTHGTHGTYVDPAALARAWHGLLEQPDKLRGMAADSRRAAEEYYEVGVMRDRFLALVREMLDPAGDDHPPPV